MPMKIRIIAFGTRGDVQPILALAHRLKEQGHHIRLIASANFQSWIEREGFEAAVSPVDIQAIMTSSGGQDWVKHGNNPLKQMQVMKKLLDQHGLQMMQAAWGACQDGEVVVSSFTSDVFAISIAEKIGAKHISTPLQPFMLPTRAGWAVPNAPRPDSFSWLNYWFGKLILFPFGWRLMGKQVNLFRQTVLGLPAVSQAQNQQKMAQMLVVQGFSPAVVPHPADWPPNIYTTGYWVLDDQPNWQPSPALQQFLEQGTPPLYVGFGSMAGADPQGLTKLIVAAGQKSGQRLVLQSGWAGLGQTQLPNSVFLLDSAPHLHLFPLMQGVVHHGGAGTTAAGLLAGKPTLIVPHLADQPFWGARVASCGVGLAPIPRPKLTAENLAEALQKLVEDKQLQERAQRFGQKLRLEDGPGRAAEVIERFLRAKKE